MPADNPIMELSKKIELDLSGPSKSERLACLERLSQADIDSSVIEILQLIENVPSNISEYRERERFLENLIKALRQKEVSESEQTQVFVFRYLLGSLYVNFEKFWGPTIRVTTELLNQSKFQARLVGILVDHLVETNDIIYNDSGSDQPAFSAEDRPDFVLHRNFIFQLMTKFAHFIESNSNIFMDQFFRFVDKELTVSPFIEKFTRDNLCSKKQEQDEPEEDEIDCPDDVKKDRPHPRGSGKNKLARTNLKRAPLSDSLIKKRKSRETFITVAKVIQSFKNISEAHRQNELRDLILNLLCCRDTSVQKASFNCLLSYNHEFLRPYTDKILKIMNDKMVRTELTLFSVDVEETDQIYEAHRGELMPIIMRILFGKMISKIGRKSSGRDKADLRKTLVMRFIAGCSPNEITYFFGLLFDPLIAHIETPYCKLGEVLATNLDIHNYVPLSKLQAMLSTLNAYMESVGNLKEETLPIVLKMINIISYFVVAPMDNDNLSSQITDKRMETLKALKRECLRIVSEFFRMFEYYNFQQDEIDFLFEHLIWTSTKGFIDRNHANPTPLLRLIETFASNRGYHKLLVKRNKINKDEYLLHHIIELYADSKSSRPILKSIASLIADIIDPDRHSPETETIGDEQAGRYEQVMIEDEGAIIPPYQQSFYKIDKELSFSQEILIGFIPTIFDRLKKNCQTFVSKKDVDNRIENDELLILSTLSEFLKDPEQSLLGARLLLTTLAYQRKGDLIVNTLKTVQVLLKQVGKTRDSSVIVLVADILGYQRNQEQRQELCNLLDVLSQVDDNLLNATEIIRLMNSISENLVDLPDLVKWNEGFRLAFNFIDGLDESQVNNVEIVQDSFILLLYQIGFIINNVDRYEFSIRENCIIFYDKLARKLNLIDPSRNSDLIRTIIDETLLEKFIKKGLREANDVIKHTFVGVLRSLAIHCHTKNKILGEFHCFCSDNQDLDFWLNIRSIQLHNRSKALARLAASDEIHKISPKTLSSYFMPIAAGFLFSKTYKSVSSLAENSIKLIGIICKQLNWVTYESTLSYYIGLLTKANATYQKTNIKLITEILKNFNFDITACKEAMETEEENSKLEKRMKKRLYLTNADDNSEAIATDAPSGKRLNPSTAKMVYFSVTKKLIPRLNSCLHEMTRVEFEHDKNMSDYLPEKEEIKRIPMAYAIVQLLNLLPGRYVLFRDQLPSLFLKLCSFLKSKNEDVRKAARSTLIKIMTFVGPAYMPDLLRVLKQNLDKGFQIHVLNYTIHSVLDKLPLQYGCLDHSVHELINLCFQEIFGKIAEDKEIAQILAKTYEAKKTKSYDTLLILSSHISADKLDYLMNSIKELLKTSTDLKKVNKLNTCIQKVFSGLAQNDQFPLDRMLNFMKVSIEESIPSLKIRQRIEHAEKPEEKKDQTKKPLREDRFLIAKELPRDRIISKINEKGNFHMVVENCLRLLLQTFEKNKALIKRKDTHKKKLDDFITLLSACLKSSSPRCVMRSLKCIHFIAQMKADLPSFKTKCNSILKRIFILLSLYNGVGMVQGDNFEMIGMCFKTISLLLLKCDHVQLNENQIRALLTYIEQDLYDASRQATAFGTLHSLVQRKCDSPELADIMVKIADLLVTSDDEIVRAISIKIWQGYLLNYTHEGSKLQTHLSKFLRQLDYEYIDGRKSVLKILSIVVTNFPEKILRNYYELIFHLLAQRVVNEESKEVRHQIGKLIGLLIQRLPDQQKYLFNKFVIPWGSVSGSPELRLLGIKMTSIFVESCKSQFTSDREKVNRILAVVADAMEDKSENSKENNKDLSKLNGNESSIDEETLEEESSNMEVVGETVQLVSINDRLLYHSLRLFKRLIDNKLTGCVETRYLGHLKRIWQNIASRMLSHPHLPVVVTGCELYLVFIKETGLANSLSVKNPTTENYLDWNAKRIVRTLCDRFFDLLDRANESSLLLAFITEGLISLSQMIANSNVTREFEKNYIESFDGGDVYSHLLQLDQLPDNGFVLDHLPYKKLEESKKQLDLVWLAIKTVNQARKEAALSRMTMNHRRNFVLRWTAAISQELGAKRLSPYVALFMMTPVRELTDKGKNKANELSLHSDTVPLSEDLLKFLKSLIGIETFNKIYSKVQLHYTKRRVDRKKKEALIKVKHQALGIKKKQVKERKNRTAKVEKGRAMIEKKRGVKRKSNTTVKQAAKKKRSR